MKTKHIVTVSLLVITTAVVMIAIIPPDRSQRTRVRYGITPYQDSALPIVAHELGWYAAAGIDVELVPLQWGDVVTALSGGAIDVAIYNFNSFQPPYANAAQGTSPPIFYSPLFLFKGQAIMVHPNRGLRPLSDIPGETAKQREARLVQIVEQLRGKRIAVTEGTELEQIVLGALAKAGVEKKDVVIVHASPEDALAAFLAGSIDAFAAGLTERVEARRHGAVELLVAADVMTPVIDGIVTTEAFAKAHPAVMDELVRLWFKTIEFIETDFESNSRYIIQYLSRSASTRYTPEEYRIAWSFDVFPRNAMEANALFHDPTQGSYWKSAWDENNKFLLEQGKITAPVPYSAYWGEAVLMRLTGQ